MSEPAPEAPVSGTGEVVDTGPDSAAADQEAEELLHDIMQDEDPEMLKKELAKWKTAAQRHERTARDNSNAAKRLRELEDANKTELQKAQDALQAAQDERDAVKTQHTRMLAAAAHDLDPELIDYLGTGTEEEINSRAEHLAGKINEAAQKMAAQLIQQNGGRPPAGARPARPVESLRPGAQPVSGVPENLNDVFRQLASGDRG